MHNITNMTISIQGQLGSYHHQVAAKLYGESVRLICRDNFKEVFDDVLSGQADYAVCAIENSSVGSINEVYDLLEVYRYPIVGEVIEHVHQNLIGFEGADLSVITKIYSHPVALAQCADFIEHQLPHAEIIEYHDTAAAVDFVRQSGEHSLAAIGSEAAARLHDMSILESGVQDEQDNYTRFLVIDPRADEQQPPSEPEPNKASLVLITSHQPGALYNALGVFAKYDCNLTKLQSRPIAGKVWQYQFYIDTEITPGTLREVIMRLSEQECTVIHLGSYRSAEQQFND